MAVTKLSNSGIATGGVLKYDSMLAGNAAYIPSGYTSLATITATGGESSLTFSSIPSTYNQLEIRYNAQVSAAFSNNNGISLRFNADTSSNYDRHILSGNGTTPSASGSANITSISADVVPSTASTNIFGTGIIDIIDYASTSKNKTVKIIQGYDQNGVAVSGGTSNGLLYLTSGLWRNLSAITSITFIPQYTWGAGSTFSLYGII